MVEWENECMGWYIEDKGGCVRLSTVSREDNVIFKGILKATTTADFLGLPTT